MEKIITLKLNNLKDFRAFMECVTKLSGSARAIQGSTNVDAKSTLGIASIMEVGSFSLKLVDCPESEAEYFKNWEV